MSLGFEQAGFDVVAALDADPIHAATHRANFPDCATLEADIGDTTGRDIRRAARLRNRTIDVVFGGPPCQGFSLMGRRDHGDARNGLLLEFARLVAELRPRYFVLENVPGLLSGHGLEYMARLGAAAASAGYRIVEPVTKLDASHYGVPQKRERVFVLGYRRGLPAPAYPKPLNGKPAPTVWDAIGDLAAADRWPGKLEGDAYCGRLRGGSVYAQTLRGEVDDPADLSAPRDANGAGVGGCARSVHQAYTIRRFEATEQGEHEPVSRFYRLAKGELAHTLRAGTGPDRGSYTAPRPIHPQVARCITVREAARLHSFPDWFQFHPTKWHGFRQVGNSVPPLLVRAVAVQLLDVVAASVGRNRKR